MSDITDIFHVEEAGAGNEARKFTLFKKGADWIRLHSSGKSTTTWPPDSDSSQLFMNMMNMSREGRRLIWPRQVPHGHELEVMLREYTDTFRTDLLTLYDFIIGSCHDPARPTPCAPLTYRPEFRYRNPQASLGSHQSEPWPSAGTCLTIQRSVYGPCGLEDGDIILRAKKRFLTIACEYQHLAGAAEKRVELAGAAFRFDGLVPPAIANIVIEYAADFQLTWRVFRTALGALFSRKVLAPYENHRWLRRVGCCVASNASTRPPAIVRIMTYREGDQEIVLCL